jgi:hypothetical protein
MGNGLAVPARRGIGEELEKTIQGQLQQRLQEALQGYRPACNQCALVMHRHHAYSKVLMELLGAEEGRKRFSKKLGKKPSS